MGVIKGDSRSLDYSSYMRENLHYQVVTGVIIRGGDYLKVRSDKHPTAIVSNAPVSNTATSAFFLYVPNRSQMGWGGAQFRFLSLELLYFQVTIQPPAGMATYACVRTGTEPRPLVP